jgi:hypothetical protein
MNFRRSLGAVGLGVLVCACGADKDANVGSDSNKHVSKDGGGSGGETGSGGDTGSGGATHSAGGAVTSAGGTAHASGGATQGAGGTTHASGGATHGTGGVTQGAGGSTGGPKCGTNTCAAGEYCCNASCGLCAPMGAACIQIACVPPPSPADAGPCIDFVDCVLGKVWSTTECACVPAPKSPCTTASDCRLVADYCNGCNCLSLGTGEQTPACSGQIAMCFLDPCSTKSAACVSGHCVAQ